MTLKCTDFKYNVVRIETLLMSALSWRKQLYRCNFLTQIAFLRHMQHLIKNIKNLSKATEQQKLNIYYISYLSENFSRRPDGPSSWDLWEADRRGRYSGGGSFLYS